MKYVFLCITLYCVLQASAHTHTMKIINDKSSDSTLASSELIDGTVWDPNPPPKKIYGRQAAITGFIGTMARFTYGSSAWSENVSVRFGLKYDGEPYCDVSTGYKRKAKCHFENHPENEETFYTLIMQVA
ncbi:hypothetical protein P9112_013323 [Eukaryota sp. TZLM1-RC]